MTRYHIWLVPIVCLVVLFSQLLIKPVVTNDAQGLAASNKPGSGHVPSGKWKEKRFAIGSESGPVWCGLDTRELVLGGDRKTNGIRILNVVSGKVAHITESPHHQLPTCSRDGRYIYYFFETSGPNDGRTLWVYDRTLRKETMLYSARTPFPGPVVLHPLSPSGRYIIGPSIVEGTVVMSGGEQAVLLSMDPPYSDVAWSQDERRMFLLNPHNPEELLVRDLVTRESRIYHLWSEDYLQRIRLSPDGTKLYVRAFARDETTNLHELPLEDLTDTERRVTPKPVLKNIDGFDVSSTGALVYSRPSSQGYELHLVTHGRDALIWKTDVSQWERGIPLPSITRDGRYIAFYQRTSAAEEYVLTVLYRNSDPTTH